MRVRLLLESFIFIGINYLIIVLLLKNWIKKTIKKSVGIWWGVAFNSIGAGILSSWQFSLLEHGLVGYYLNIYVASLVFAFGIAIVYITDPKGKI